VQVHKDGENVILFSRNGNNDFTTRFPEITYAVRTLPTNSFIIDTEPHALLKVVAEHRMEGIVSKRVDRPYVSGPSKVWIKVKCGAWREQNGWRHEFFQSRGR
jgi:ATP-dependent DNA ligase